MCSPPTRRCTVRERSAPDSESGETVPRRLRAELLQVLASVLPRGERVALVDSPFHDNAGDSAIWLGEEAALRELGHEVAYRTSSAA